MSKYKWREARKIAVGFAAIMTAVMSTGSVSAEEYHFGMIFPGLSGFYNAVEEGAQEEAAQISDNTTVEIECSQFGDVDEQIQLMQNMIDEGVDGIAIAPTDSSALTSYIDDAVAKGIFIVCFDTDAPDSDRYAFVGTNNYEAGQEVGEQLGYSLNQAGTVIVEAGVASQSVMVQRLKGMEDLLEEKYPDIHIAEISYSGGNIQKCSKDIEDMISRHPDFNALVQLDASGSVGINIYKAHGWMKEDRKLIIFDDTTAIIDGIRNGQVTCSITQQQKNWGVESIKALHELCKGNSVDEMAYTEIVVVNDNNVDEFYPE